MEPDAVALKLSVIVPCYKTGPQIVGALDRLVVALDVTGLSYEVVVVADGDPRSFAFASACASDKVRVLGYKGNKGKGFALRYGMTEARGDIVTFIDADMQIGPEEIGRMVSLMSLYDADIVVGSKRHPMSQVSYPLPRRIQSIVYQLLVRLLFQVKVRDTQTGLKVLRREVAADVIQRAIVKRFAFDLELLTIATHLGHRRIIEAPVTIDHQFSSTTSAGAALDVLQDTLAIFYRLRILNYYDRPISPGREELRVSTPDLLHVP